MQGKLTVIAIDSVPPSVIVVSGDISTYFETHLSFLHAKAAVTKTVAKPPMPPTNGAAPTFQFLPPIYSPERLPPQFTTMPRIMNIFVPLLAPG